MLNQEALEAARAAYQSAIPVRPWRADGGETDAPIRAAITAYLSTLAPTDNGLVKRLRHSAENLDEGPTGWPGAYKEAADALTASQADRTALAAENERLKADLARVTSPEYLTGALEMIDVVDKEWQVRAEAAEARAASLQTLLDKAMKALEPFADIAGEAWADEIGWTEAACQNDRVCDWFGPSAFRIARCTLTAIQEARHAGN